MKQDAADVRYDARPAIGVRQQNISLIPDDWRALRLLAARERNGNISAAVARMIDEQMTRSYGIDWRLQAPLAQFER